MNNPLVFFDIETTGVDTREDEITQIGAITIQGDRPLSNFEIKIQPSLQGKKKIEEARKAYPQAFNYDEAIWAKEAVDKVSAIKKFSDYIRKYAWVELIAKSGRLYRVAMLAGHNILGFDKEFMIRYGRETNTFIPMDMRGLDTMPVYLEYCIQTGYGLQNLTLGAFVEHMGVTFEGEAHDALVDATANARAYIELCRRRGLL